MPGIENITLPGWEARKNYAPKAPASAGGRWGLFYDSYDLEEMESNWDKSYPFQFLILNEERPGQFTILRKEGRELKFTLPIPPEAMTITMPFAINGSVTGDGYIEQHGGAPIRMISLSGTTGLLPTRGSGDVTTTPSLGQAVFAGTLQAASGFAASIATIKNGTPPPRPNVYPDDFGDADPTKLVSKSTGYYQFLLFQRFLEAYASMARTREGRTYRLAFAIWKDEAVYLTTPVAFSLKRSVDSPLERKFDLQLKAYGRISPDQLGLSLNDVTSRLSIVSGRDPGTLAQIFNQVRAVRGTLQQAASLIRAVGGDVENVVLGTLREVSFFAQDSIGLASTMIDFPHALIQDFATYLFQQWRDVYYASVSLIAQAGSQSEQFQEDFGLLDDAAHEQVASPGTLRTHPAFDIFENPDDHSEILSVLDPSAMVLPAALREKLDAERLRIRTLNRRDFEQRRDALVAASAAYADAVGAGSDTYNLVYGRGTAQIARRTPTDADFEVLFQLNAAIIELSRLAAHADLTDRQPITAMEYIAGLANQSGIDFRVPRSKFAVPMLYDHSLEDMAALYLGTPDRWMEIAALNGLREPYVDEDGFLLPLLVNAHGNTVIVSDAQELYIGQPVWLESTNAPQQKRRVVSATQISTGLCSVLLDGDPIDEFTLAGKARVHAFRPHTVNSQMLVFMPSDNDAPVDPRTKAIPGVDDFDHLLTVGGIDLLLTPDRDLVITPDGDGRWAYGFTNIIQQAGIILATPKGSLKRHPSFGVGTPVGISTARVSAQDILESARVAFQQDPTYSGVKSATVLKKGPLAQLVLSVGIAGTSQDVPIGVDLARDPGMSSGPTP